MTTVSRKVESAGTDHSLHYVSLMNSIIQALVHQLLIVILAFVFFALLATVVISGC